MARPPRWSEDEIEALRAIGPRDRAGMARFRARFPRHSNSAVSNKLMLLRVRREAADTRHGRSDSPYPKHRFD